MLDRYGRRGWSQGGRIPGRGAHGLGRRTPGGRYGCFDLCGSSLIGGELPGRAAWSLPWPRRAPKDGSVCCYGAHPKMEACFVMVRLLSS